MSSFKRPLAILLGCMLATISSGVAPHKAAAQNGFYFKPPALTLEMRFGRTLRDAKSDVFSFMTNSLTLDKKDFQATSFAGDLAIRSSDRSDFVIAAGYAKSSAPSESRKFIGTDDKPISQHTSLTSVPFTAGVRFYPLSRGTSIGQYAYIPSAFNPYIGAGFGGMHYSLVQEGEFVDESDLSITADRLQSSGTAMMIYAEGGAQYWINQHVGLQADARYTSARAAMGHDYEGFNDIDLRGAQVTAGFAVRF